MDLDVAALDMLPEREESRLYPCNHSCEYTYHCQLSCEGTNR
ncbi:ALQxL family class IV lanthipeptide [Streptosporangium jomthongense]|uniref:ALQxL family class IV lanthipeptide n=1 Tax=Streptosporangium jomthongense TaxID=1193683 RepID=A0ABV8ESR1_9ACTN